MHGKGVVEIAIDEDGEEVSAYIFEPAAAMRMAARLITSAQRALELQSASEEARAAHSDDVEAAAILDRIQTLAKMN